MAKNNEVEIFTPEKLVRITVTNNNNLRELAAGLVLNGWTSKKDFGGILRYDRPSSFFVTILPIHHGPNGSIRHYDVVTNYAEKDLTFMELLAGVYDRVSF